MSEEAKPEKKRTRGLGSVFQRGGRWWVKYYVRGKPYRESSDSEKRGAAVRLLKRRLGEVASGRFHPGAEKVTFEDLAKGLEADYLKHRRRTWDRALVALAHLICFFSGSGKTLSALPKKWKLADLMRIFGDCRAVDVTPGAVNDYIAARLQSGAKPATVRNELAALGRMFTLAAELGKVPHRPRFPSIQVNNARQGFFEEDDLHRVMGFLPAHLKPVLLFAALTGWRKSEVVGLMWKRVDFAAGTVRLEVGTTKNREGRVFPFDVLPELAELLRVQRERHVAFEKTAGRIVASVFHRQGNALCDFHGAWRSACRKAGVPGRLFHDLRRTAVRNLERAGVPRSWAMQLTGHKTESVYRRYAIVSEKDLREGVARLAASRTGTERAQLASARPGAAEGQGAEVAVRQRAEALPATVPLLHAHWKLNPPSRPSTSRISPHR